MSTTAISSCSHFLQSASETLSQQAAGAWRSGNKWQTAPSRLDCWFNWQTKIELLHRSLKLCPYAMSLLLETVLQHPLRSPSTTAPYKRTFMNCLFAPLFWLKVRVWTVHHSFTKTPLESKLIPTDVQKTSYSVLLSVTSGSSADCFPISSWMNVQSLPSSLDVEPLPAALRSEQLTCTNPPTLPSQCCWLTPAPHWRHTEGSGLWLYLIFWDKIIYKGSPYCKWRKSTRSPLRTDSCHTRKNSSVPSSCKNPKRNGKSLCMIWSEDSNLFSLLLHLLLFCQQPSVPDLQPAQPEWYMPSTSR